MYHYSTHPMVAFSRTGIEEIAQKLLTMTEPRTVQSKFEGMNAVSQQAILKEVTACCEAITEVMRELKEKVSQLPARQQRHIQGKTQTQAHAGEILQEYLAPMRSAFEAQACDPGIIVALGIHAATIAAFGMAAEDVLRVLGEELTKR